MSAAATLPVLGRDIFPLAFLRGAFTPEFQALVDRYAGGFLDPNGDTSAWTAATRAIAEFTPVTPADRAGKLLFGLHYHSPTCRDGVLTLEPDMIDESGDMAILIGCVRDALAPIVAPEATEWHSLVAKWQAALKVERDYDAEHIAPHVDHLPVSPERTAACMAIPAQIWEESERLTNLRGDAEDPLMDHPSPDAAAFALKFLIAYGDGRDTDGWNGMLEREARAIVSAAGLEFGGAS